MDFGLSESQKIMVDMARDFFEKEAKDFARKVEKDEKQFSPEIWKKMAELGWLGIVFPEEYGGTEGDFVDLLLLLEEMGKALIPVPSYPRSSQAWRFSILAPKNKKGNSYLP